MNRPAPGAIYALAVLFAINLMNFFDRQMIGGVGEGIRREWGLSDTALGLLGTVFTLLYAVFGLPLGRMSDTGPRRIILAGGVFVWSLLTAARAWARQRHRRMDSAALRLAQCVLRGGRSGRALRRCRAAHARAAARQS